MNLKELKEPLDPKYIEWRIGRAGEKNGNVWALALAYITARAVHDRLDEVCGPENWQLRYKEHLGGTVCEIGVKIGDEWIWKSGGADSTEFEAFKGGLSGAEKRAAVPWGIGRYLYDLPETFVEVSTSKMNGWNYQSKGKNSPAFWWKSPDLPAWALPEGVKQEKRHLEGNSGQPNLDTGEIAQPTQRPYDAETVKAKISASILDGVLIDVTKRYELSKWLVGQSSTQKMTQPSINALFDWLGTEKAFNAVPSDEVVKEIHAAHTAALKASGQEELL